MSKKLLLAFLILLVASIVLLLTTFPLIETEAYPETDPVTDTVNQSRDVLFYLRQLEDLRVEESGQATEALIILAGQEDAIGYQANLALTDRLVFEDNAEPYFRRALELYDSKDVRHRLADYLVSQENYKAATLEYLSLLPDVWALDSLVELGALPGVIIQQLIEGKHWQAVLDYMDMLSADEEKPFSADYMQALVELGRYKTALPLLKDALKSFPDDTDTRWRYARSLEAEGQTSEAQKIYTSLGPQGARRLALLLEKEGKVNHAAAAYAQSEERAALWRGAVLWDELGNKEEALKLYLRLTAEPGVYQDDAAYRSYLLLKNDDDQRAEEMLALLSHYPAWMNRLGMEPSWSMAPEPDTDVPIFIKKAEAYREAGRNDLVSLELAIAGKNATPEEKIFLGEWYFERRSYPLAVRWGSMALRDLPSTRAYYMAYPRPFAEAVERAAEEYNLEPALIWAVMREESRFQADALSRAGALGLMQIMPATGGDIAKRLKVELTEWGLLDAELNIRFGAYYLRAMLNMFGDDLDKALAAYNGGGGNVGRWSRSNLGRTAEGFPTAIAFFETREYITKVKNSYLTYKWLY
ncbi:MAG: transglycosylase SLT domain-containing protein [Clostridiales bacterium]|jgi:soluble lytic murein transglycosylase|nr:transglycosylase SLT domain-containing protein [Clostridiales bacterium]